MTNQALFAEYGFTCHGAEYRLVVDYGYYRAFQGEDGRWCAELVPRGEEPIALRNGSRPDFDDSIMAALACLAYEVEQEVEEAQMEQLEQDATHDLTPPSRSPRNHDRNFLGQS